MISRAAVEHGREQSLGWPLGGVAARAAGGQDARTRHGEVNLPVRHAHVHHDLDRSQMLYAGQSFRGSVTFFSDF